MNNILIIIIWHANGLFFNYFSIKLPRFYTLSLNHFGFTNKFINRGMINILCFINFFSTIQDQFDFINWSITSFGYSFNIALLESLVSLGLDNWAYMNLLNLLVVQTRFCKWCIRIVWGFYIWSKILIYIWSNGFYNSINFILAQTHSFSYFYKRVFELYCIWVFFISHF